MSIGLSGPRDHSLSDSAITPAPDTVIRALLREENELFAWLGALARPASQFLGL